MTIGSITTDGLTAAMSAILLAVISLLLVSSLQIRMPASAGAGTAPVSEAHHALRLSRKRDTTVLPTARR